MAESTLTLKLSDFRNRVAYYLGYGRDYAACTTDQKADIDQAVEDGYRWFLFPMSVPNRPVSHSWRFLKPTGTITLWAAVAESTTVTISGGAYADPVTPMTASAATFTPEMVGSAITIGGTSPVIASYVSATVINVVGDASGVAASPFSIAATGRIRLPDNVASIEGNLIVQTPQFRGREVELVDAARVEMARNAAESSGWPQYAAYRPVASDQSVGQKAELLIWPDPSTDIVCQYRAVLRADKLVATTNEYPLGGMEHGQTILAAMEAAAEFGVMDDREGPRFQMFVRLLQASIDNDRRKSPPSLGYNGDRSNRMRGGRRPGASDCGSVASYGSFEHPYL